MDNGGMQTTRKASVRCVNTLYVQHALHDISTSKTISSHKVLNVGAHFTHPVIGLVI